MNRNVTYQGLAGLGRFVDEDTCASLSGIEKKYPFKVSSYYAELGRLCSMGGNDAVNRQFMPDLREIEDVEGLVDDPFAEESAPAPGLVHRFSDRVLILATSDCAVNCRHCTRKNTVRKLAGMPSENFFEPALSYVRAHTGIREVIISGGDPLLIDAGLLDWLLGSVLLVPHVEVIRVGTRVPVVCPGLIDDDMADLLKRNRPVWINTQFNHPAELTGAAIEACGKLTSQGIPVSNQSVLLRGINDSAELMVELCNALQKNIIRPYYVFQCDPVRGTSHFMVPPARARDIAISVQNSVGGLACPRFVRDVPGRLSKTPLI